MTPLSLTDITNDAWTVIATSSLDHEQQRRWDYRISQHDRYVMRMAREGGALLTAQRRVAEDCYELVARLAAPGTKGVRR